MPIFGAECTLLGQSLCYKRGGFKASAIPCNFLARVPLRQDRWRLAKHFPNRRDFCPEAREVVIYNLSSFSPGLLLETWKQDSLKQMSSPGDGSLANRFLAARLGVGETRGAAAACWATPTFLRSPDPRRHCGSSGDGRQGAMESRAPSLPRECGWPQVWLTRRIRA